MFEKILLSFLIIFYISQVCLSDGMPEVQTRLGKIQGLFKPSLEGKYFATFEGVPYAQPPIGDLRFEDPVPVKPWSGLFPAKRPRMCVQPVKLRGEEDCLYLNIYVPSDTFDQNRKFDVLVTIHGGGFLTGTAQDVKPEYLMDKDIILVTINYRLGILGFLSTGDEVLPGNYGLKDQVAALKWVKRNIHYFGGNNESITIAGSSAGGASVHLHYLSPLSKGLFTRGISHSGNALDPWVIKRQPLRNTKRLAASLNCVNDTLQETKACLKTKNEYLLLGKQKEFYGYERAIPIPIAPFGPVIEKSSKNAFLTQDPYVLLKEKKVLDAPWIVSTCKDEGLILTRPYYSELEKVDEDWPEVAHYFLDYNDTLPVSKREKVANKVKDYYLGPGKHINVDNFLNFTKILTDRLFVVGAETAARLQAQANKSPVYYYLFSHTRKEKKRKAKKQKDQGTTDNIPQGILHGADGDFFYGINLIEKPKKSTKVMLKACQEMLNSYASTGKPSFDGSDKWKPTKGSKLTFLNITDANNMQLETKESLSPLKFWNSLGLLEQENLRVKDEL